MDAKDLKILEILSENARVSGAEIARQVYLSLPAVTERLRKLNESGVIDKHTIVLSKTKLGLNLCCFIKVWISQVGSADVLSDILAMDEVLECHHIAGDYDLLLKVLVEGTDQLEFFLTKKLKVIPGVSRTSTTIVLDTYKEKINRNIENKR